MDKIIQFDELLTSDLIKGTLYKGGPKNNLSSEPISKILPVGNQGGIRFSGKIDNPDLVVLYTIFQDKEWPDLINMNRVTYFGDNKMPGKEIHDLPGNRVLRAVFNKYHLSKQNMYPPIYLFSKGPIGFDRIFEGLLKPGYTEISESEDLVAVWKTKDNQRYQNYKATFTLLPNMKVERKDFFNPIVV